MAPTSTGFNEGDRIAAPPLATEKYREFVIVLPKDVKIESAGSLDDIFSGMASNPAVIYFRVDTPVSLADLFPDYSIEVKP